MSYLSNINQSQGIAIKSQLYLVVAPSIRENNTITLILQELLLQIIGATKHVMIP